MTTRSIYFVFIVLASLLPGNADAQVLDVNKAVTEDTELSAGTVTLTDGSTLAGKLKLNTKTGLLIYEDGTISKTFNARNVLGFSYFDKGEIKTRNFLSIAYKRDKPKNDKPLAVVNSKMREKSVPEMATPIFCEIQVECKTFALLSTVGQMNVTQVKIDPASPLTPTLPSTTYTQTETALIIDEKGVVTPILDVTHSETERLLIDEQQTKNKKRNKSVLEEYTTVYYEQLKEYAKERKLSFKKIEDLVKILEHYKSLEMN